MPSATVRILADGTLLWSHAFGSITGPDQGYGILVNPVQEYVLSSTVLTSNFSLAPATYYSTAIDTTVFSRFTPTCSRCEAGTFSSTYNSAKCSYCPSMFCATKK